MVKVKICGLTNYEDAILAAELGADALGFIFYKDSPRYVDFTRAYEICRSLPPFIFKVGVFVDEDISVVNQYIEALRLDRVQLHGNESPEYCRQIKCGQIIKSFRLKESKDLSKLANYDKVSAFLLDAYHPKKPGGTGQTFDWQLAIEAKKYSCPIILSGGLTPENVVAAIRLVRPYAVDVASGVESSPGKKEPLLLKLFIEEAKRALI